MSQRRKVEQEIGAGWTKRLACFLFGHKDKAPALRQATKDRYGWDKVCGRCGRFSEEMPQTHTDSTG